MPAHLELRTMKCLALDSDDMWNLICESFVPKKKERKKREEIGRSINSDVSMAL